MEVNKDRLIQILTKIDDRLSNIERYLSMDKNTNPDSSTKKDTKLIYKNTIDFELLIDTISDTNSKNIVNQIYLNKYPTITSGQYNLIMNIAEQNNVDVVL
jgi:hypothetical protein